MENYLAFISYRHQKQDQKVSVLLRKYLESFHLPATCPIPKHRKCFRDTDELPTSTDLGTDIERALSGSDWLIAVCSEEYVKSRWCMREIELFIEQGRKNRILPVLISGTPESAIPDVIRDLPVALDLRSSNRIQIREAIPQLLYAMSGTDPEAIASSDRRHRSLVLSGIFGGIGLLLSSFILYASMTAQRIQKNNEEIAAATEQAKKAEEEAEAQIYNFYLKKAGYVAREAWLSIRSGNDREALENIVSVMPRMEDSPSYAVYLPDPLDAVDALRMALAMPQRQRAVYGGWSYSSFFEDLDIDDPDNLPYTFTGNYTAYPLHTGYSLSFQDTVFLMETTDSSGVSYRISFDEYGTAEIEEQYPDFKDRAAGYIHSYACLDGSRILYGNHKNLILRGSGQKEIHYCIEGKPFPADQIFVSPGDEAYILACGPDGAALFLRSQKEAAAVLPVEGIPICAVFNPTRKQIAIIDPEGRLSLFLTEDGTKTAQAEDTFRYVTYAGENYRFYAVTENGEFKKMNALTLESERTFEAPRPVKTVSYCARRNIWLVVTDHFVFILDGDSGSVMSGSFFWGEPVACAWEGFDEASWSHEGDGYMLICKDQVYFDRINIAEDYDISIPLTDEEISQNCIHAMFSSDERYVYLEYEDGSLSCWDPGSSDPYEWVRTDIGWGNSRPDCPNAKLSIDEMGIWRPVSSGNGVEYIDAETGDILYRSSWKHKCDCSLLRESGNGWDGLSLGTEYDAMTLFDTGSGDVYWSRDGLGDAVFTEDADEILALEAESTSSNPFAGGEKHLVFRRIDIETGEITDEQILCTLEAGEPGEIVMDQETLSATVDGLWQVDLRDLTAVKTVQKQDNNLLLFAGENCVIEREDGQTVLRNADDQHLVIDAGPQQILLSPSGDVALLYGGGRTPFIMFALDTDDLTWAAMNRLDAYEEEAENWKTYSEEDYQELL